MARTSNRRRVNRKERNDNSSNKAAVRILAELSGTTTNSL
jgi:hypothetical protein